jgi:hypothetical protein
MHDALHQVRTVGAPTHALRDRAATARAAILASPVRPASVEKVVEAAIPAAANPTLRGLHLNRAARDLAPTVADRIRAARGRALIVADPTRAAQGRALLIVADPIRAAQGRALIVADRIRAARDLAPTAADPTRAAQGRALIVADRIRAARDPAPTVADPIRAAQDLALTVADPIRAAQDLALIVADPTRAARDLAPTVADPIRAAQGLAPTAGALTEGRVAKALVVVMPRPVLSAVSLTFIARVRTPSTESRAFAARTSTTNLRSLLPISRGPTLWSTSPALPSRGPKSTPRVPKLTPRAPKFTARSTNPKLKVPATIARGRVLTAPEPLDRSLARIVSHPRPGVATLRAAPTPKASASKKSCRARALHRVARRRIGFAPVGSPSTGNPLCSVPGCRSPTNFDSTAASFASVRRVVAPQRSLSTAHPARA